MFNTWSSEELLFSGTQTWSACVQLRCHWCLSTLPWEMWDSSSGRVLWTSISKALLKSKIDTTSETHEAREKLFNVFFEAEKTKKWIQKMLHPSCIPTQLSHVYCAMRTEEMYDPCRTIWFELSPSEHDVLTEHFQDYSQVHDFVDKRCTLRQFHNPTGPMCSNSWSVWRHLLFNQSHRSCPRKLVCDLFYNPFVTWHPYLRTHCSLIIMEWNFETLSEQTRNQCRGSESCRSNHNARS